MRKYKKLILAGVVAAALAGGAGAAVAATGGGEHGTSTITNDDGKPGFHKSGTPSKDGKGESRKASDGRSRDSYRVGKSNDSYRTPNKDTSQSAEKGKTNAKQDDGKPGLHKSGTPPKDGGKPETHSYRAR